MPSAPAPPAGGGPDRFPGVADSFEVLQSPGDVRSLHPGTGTRHLGVCGHPNPMGRCATLQCCPLTVRPRHHHRTRDSRAPGNALGPGSLLGDRPQNWLFPGECPIGIGGDKARLSRCLPPSPLPRPCRRILRVANCRQTETTVAIHPTRPSTVCLRRPLGMLDRSDAFRRNPRDLCSVDDASE